MMKSMIVIEYDILPEIEIKIDMPLILPFNEILQYMMDRRMEK